MTLSAREIVDALSGAGLRPAHRLGQHFVVDPNTVRRIARLAGVGPGERVVEIGAGLGSLTLALAETGASVVAVEIDRGLAPILERHVAGQDVRVVVGDAMTLDWDEVLAGDPADDRPWVLVANLPYNVGTPLLADLLDSVQQITRFLVMVQLEVAERLVAPAGDTHRGALSVKVDHWSTARIVGHVPRTVFHPRPAVESALVELRRRPNPAVTSVSAEVLFATVATAFGQRRKMLRSSLSALVDAAGFEAAAVAPTARPQDLDIASWGRLAAVARPQAGA